MLFTCQNDLRRRSSLFFPSQRGTFIYFPLVIYSIFVLLKNEFLPILPRSLLDDFDELPFRSLNPCNSLSLSQDLPFDFFFLTHILFSVLLNMPPNTQPFYLKTSMFQPMASDSLVLPSPPDSPQRPPKGSHSWFVHHFVDGLIPLVHPFYTNVCARYGVSSTQLNQTLSGSQQDSISPANGWA